MIVFLTYALAAPRVTAPCTLFGVPQHVVVDRDAGTLAGIPLCSLADVVVTCPDPFIFDIEARGGVIYVVPGAPPSEGVCTVEYGRRIPVAMSVVTSE